MAPWSFQANRSLPPSSVVTWKDQTLDVLRFFFFTVRSGITFKWSSRAVDSTLSFFSSCKQFIFFIGQWERVNKTLIRTASIKRHTVGVQSRPTLTENGEIFRQRTFLKKYSEIIKTLLNCTALNQYYLFIRILHWIIGARTKNLTALFHNISSNLVR